MNKIIILSAETNVAPLYKAAVELGYYPTFVYSSEMSNIDYDYPTEIIDFYGTPQDIVIDINNKLGEIHGIVNCIEQYVQVVGEVSKLLGLGINPSKSYNILSPTCCT